MRQTLPVDQSFHLSGDIQKYTGAPRIIPSALTILSMQLLTISSQIGMSVLVARHFMQAVHPRATTPPRFTLPCDTFVLDSPGIPYP